ncbi:hypothetical protein SUGI_0112200 [Cryptomeria japonica]|nr:hypothetical protein SUGI_0112200 [Cryptomeria japonica]
MGDNMGMNRAPINTLSAEERGPLPITLYLQLGGDSPMGSLAASWAFLKALVQSLMLGITGSQRTVQASTWLYLLRQQEFCLGV